MKGTKNLFDISRYGDQQFQWVFRVFSVTYLDIRKAAQHSTYTVKFISYSEQLCILFP